MPCNHEIASLLKDGISALAAHGEDGTEPRMAAQHAVVGFGDALEREDFVFRTNAGKHAEGKCILRIDGGARIPAFDGQASSEELTGRNREGRRGADDHEASIGTETADDGRHGIAIRYGRQDHFGAAQIAQLGGGVLRPWLSM